MNSTHHTEPLAIDLLLTEDQRRTVTIDDHAEARQRIASQAAAAETKARQLAAIRHPIRIAETDPAAVPDIEELLEELRSAEYEERGARP